MPFHIMPRIDIASLQIQSQWPVSSTRVFRLYKLVPRRWMPVRSSRESQAENEWDQNRDQSSLSASHHGRHHTRDGERAGSAIGFRVTGRRGMIGEWELAAGWTMQ
jgi:hypothetical protein